MKRKIERDNGIGVLYNRRYKTRSAIQPESAHTATETEHRPGEQRSNGNPLNGLRGRRFILLGLE